MSSSLGLVQCLQLLAPTRRAERYLSFPWSGPISWPSAARAAAFGSEPALLTDHYVTFCYVYKFYAVLCARIVGSDNLGVMCCTMVYVPQGGLGGVEAEIKKFLIRRQDRCR